MTYKQIETSLTALKGGAGGMVEELTKKKEEEKKKKKEKNKRTHGQGQQCHDYRGERVWWDVEEGNSGDKQRWTETLLRVMNTIQCRDRASQNCVP